jgi:hypothetical protein
MIHDRRTIGSKKESPPVTCSNLIHIENGFDVHGSDGPKIGRIDELGPGYVVVTNGLFARTELFVPIQAISDVDPHARAVRLTVAADSVDEMRWDEPLVDASADGGW